MNIEALKKVFPEGSEFTVNIPVKFTVEAYEGDEDTPYIALSGDVDREKLGAVEAMDPTFVEDLRFYADCGIYPKAFMTLIGKEANKVKTQLKKELQAQIKKLQDELDSL